MHKSLLSAVISGLSVEVLRKYEMNRIACLVKTLNTELPFSHSMECTENMWKVTLVLPWLAHVNQNLVNKVCTNCAFLYTIRCGKKRIVDVSFKRKNINPTIILFLFWEVEVNCISNFGSLTTTLKTQ